MASHDVAITICQALARHVIQRILNPPFLSYMASYNEVINICQALRRGVAG
jgi:hypothetical protein